MGASISRRILVLRIPSTTVTRHLYLDTNILIVELAMI